MTSEMELLRMGVAALQAGNREGAITTLSQVVDMNPFNEQAWFYLAAADNDPFMRKRYLQRVLELNPKNAKARDILDKLLAKEDSVVVNTPSSPKPPLAPPTPPTKTPPPPIEEDPLGAILNPVLERSPQSPPPLQQVPSEPAFTLSWDSPLRDTADDLPDIDNFTATRSASRGGTVAFEDQEELFARLGMDDADAPSASSAPKSDKVSFKTLRPLAADAGSLLGSAGEKGFALPIDIPGSPARVSAGSFARGGITLLRGSTRILTRRKDAYTSEIERATWWRFLLYALFISAIQTVFLALIVWIVDGRITATTPGRAGNFFGGLVMLLLGVPFYIGTLIAGSGISFLIQRRLVGIRTTFLKHLYAQTVVWLPISLVATALAFVFNLLGLVRVDNYSLIAIVTTIGLSVLAAFTHYAAVQHFTGDPMLDQKERRRRRLAAASTVIGIFVVRLLVGLLLVSITGVTLLVFLFS